MNAAVISAVGSIIRLGVGRSYSTRQQLPYPAGLDRKRVIEPRAGRAAGGPVTLSGLHARTAAGAPSKSRLFAAWVGKQDRSSSNLRSRWKLKAMNCTASAPRYRFKPIGMDSS